MSTTADDRDVPIPGPAPKGPEYPWEPDREEPMSFAKLIVRFTGDLVRKPTHWVRENIVEPNKGPKYYWYHRRYNRPLPIDECYLDDQACIYEAQLDYARGFHVDRETLNLLRYRRDSCWFWNVTTTGAYHPSDKCKDIADTYDREEINFFIKYGDMRFRASVIDAYNKQKHRMIMERRKALRDAKTQEEQST